MGNKFYNANLGQLLYIARFTEFRVAAQKELQRRITGEHK